jgi:hypothetical protein
VVALGERDAEAFARGHVPQAIAGALHPTVRAGPKSPLPRYAEP